MAQHQLLGLIDMVSRILRHFAETNDANLSTAISNAIESIGEFTGVDQSYVFELDQDLASAQNTHRWCTNEIPVCQLAPVVFSLMPEWHSHLCAGKPIYIPSVQDLPDSRKYERDLLTSEGIKSTIVLPLMASNTLHGFVGFESCAQARTWDDVEITLLRSVADIIVSAFVRIQNQKTLAQKEQRFRRLMQHSSDVITIIDSNRVIQYASGSIHELLGWEPSRWLGQPYYDVVHTQDIDRLKQTLLGATPDNAIALPDFRIRAIGGGYKWFSGKATDLRDDNSVQGWVINAHDITLRKQAEQALHHQANHDSLTGLANRARLLDEMQRRRESEETMGLLFMDLDHFKTVNDALGHDIGDQLLVDVAIRLQDRAEAGDIIARFGGDEFVLLMGPHRNTATAIVEAASRFLKAFDAPFSVKNRARAITASAGVVVTSGKWDPGEILRDADAAMYQAKAKGRHCLQIFDADMQRVLHEKVDLANDLRNSELRGELYLLYQPLYDNDGTTLRSVEALVRWKHPQKGIISPVEFIPVAEDTGAILPIGVWVLNEALGQMRKWLDQHPRLDDFSVAVNLSTRQLAMPGLVDIISAALMRHRVQASRLTIELTESALMSDVEDSRHVLRNIQALGCKIAIDDFGTGYSSMAYLRDLPATALKIDKSFVGQMLQSERDLRIMAAMLNIATELGMQTVAEGVESEEQMLALRQLNCTQLQGFYLMRPSPPELVEPLLDALECKYLPTKKS